MNSDSSEYQQLERGDRRSKPSPAPQRRRTWAEDFEELNPKARISEGSEDRRNKRGLLPVGALLLAAPSVPHKAILLL